MFAVIVGLVGAVLGSAVGSWVTWLLGKADREQALTRNKQWSRRRTHAMQLQSSVYACAGS